MTKASSNRQSSRTDAKETTHGRLRAFRKLNISNKLKILREFIRNFVGADVNKIICINLNTCPAAPTLGFNVITATNEDNQDFAEYICTKPGYQMQYI